MKRRRSVPPEQQPQETTTGSSSPGEPVFLAVGRLRRSHGLNGEILMDVLTDFPERLHVGKSVYVGDSHEEMHITGVRGHDRELIVHLRGITNPEEVARLRNALVFVKASDLPGLPEGEFYHHQLLGLTIVNEEQAVLGTLDSILETGANDVYVVTTPEGKELLLPAVDEVVLEVDLAKRQMVVRPPEWL